MPDYAYTIEEENTKMDKESAKLAILELRKAIDAVRKCNTVAECWIVKDLKLHIDELQNEIGGIEYEKNIGDR